MSILSSGFIEYAEIVDPLYRFAAGQDTRDRALLESAFTENATFDFSHAAARIGAAIPVFEGRDAIVDTITSALRSLRTVHTVTNARILSRSETVCRIYALVEALHVSEADERRYLLLKNIYRVEQEPQSQSWRLSRVVVENVWADGDVTLLGGRAAG